MKQSLQLAAFLSSLIALSGCSVCENEILQSVSSPSGQLRAVVFNRNCGATTGFNTQVSIIAAADSLADASGNTLILDGTIPLQVHWQSHSVLHLSGLGSAEIFKQASSASGASVSYSN